MQNIGLTQAIPELRKQDGEVQDGGYGNMLAPLMVRPYAVIEVLVGMGLIFACSYLLRPQDPLFMESEFPWLWLPATVFALRYGAILGALAGVSVAAAWILFYGLHNGDYFPIAQFAGGMALLLVVGHFCDLWQARTRRLKALNTYLDESLRSLTNHHYLLKLSHQRLERDSLTKPLTLRDACEMLHALSSGQDNTVLPHVDAVLSFAANGCRLDQASVFSIDGQFLSAEPVASVGAPFELNASDVLVQACLTKQSLVHLRPVEGERSEYLVCVPIVTASDRLLGILAVRRMSFLALNEENLRFLLALLSYYASGIEKYHSIQQVLSSVPRCPDSFAAELARLARLHQQSGIKSSLVGLVLPRGAGSDALIEQLRKAHRILDLIWEYEREASRVFIALLPLTDELGRDGYLARVDLIAQSQLHASLETANVACFHGPVERGLPGFGLTAVVARCNRHG